LVGRQVEMVGTLGADVEPAFRLLAKDGGLALRAADPQPLGHPAFRPTGHCHGSIVSFTRRPVPVANPGAARRRAVPAAGPPPATVTACDWARASAMARVPRL